MQFKVPFARTKTLRNITQCAIWAAFAAVASAQEAPTTESVETEPVYQASAEPAPSDASATRGAQPTQAAATPEYSTAFQAGLSALSRGRNAEAVAAFQAAFNADPNPAALMNLGIAYTNLGQPNAAVQALRQYVAQADAERDAERIQAVRQEITRLRAESGRIGLHLIPEHAIVELDSEPVEIADGELLATPGRHTISASADGYTPFSQSVDVVAGEFTLEIELKRVDLSLVAQPVPPEEGFAPALPEPSEEPERVASSQCVLKEVCLGPVLSLLGPPNLLGGGLHARIGRYLGIGIDYQVLPTLNLNPVSFGASLLSANARVYPFGGAFFLSGGIGYQSFRGEFRDSGITVSARTSFPAAMASVGFMGKSGFVLGADLGLMFPLTTLRASVQDETGALSQSAIPQADIDAAREQAQSSVNKSLKALPLLVQVNLLRVGYMF